jgi:hypothetical protein
MKNITLILSVLVTVSLNAQQVRVGRSSINCVGSSTVSNGILISQTGGQSSSVTVSKSGNLSIRQGFQQSNVMRYEIVKTDFSVQLFPNPNDGNFNVALNGFEANETVSYQIVDVNGKKMQESQVSTPATFAVSIPSIQPGIYYLILNSLSGKTASIKFIIQ